MPRRSSKPPTGSAYDAGIRLLARRAHSRAELRTKLGRRGFAEAEVETAVGKLVELGYLDDRSFASAHVRRRSALKGPLALRAELSARGVERWFADEALARFDQPAQLASARKLGARLSGTKPFAGYRELLESVGPKLIRRGFAPGIARAACWDLWITSRRDTSGPFPA